jgi:hypothetical protein
LYQNQNASVYNRNQDSHAIENVARWYDYWRERPGTGLRVSAGGVNIIFSDSNTHHRGAENYRRSGEVDALRLPKDGYFANQVMWDGWVDVDHPGTHIIGHWNYGASVPGAVATGSSVSVPGAVATGSSVSVPGAVATGSSVSVPGAVATGSSDPQAKANAPTTVTKNIYVVSSAEKVELFINGKSQGFGAQSHRFLFTFKNIKWRPGTISAVGYDAAGRKISNDQKQTAGEPAAIRLTPHVGPLGLRADGADVALVDVEVVDAKGQRCPTALNLISFSLSGAVAWPGRSAGPAEWRGGIAQGPDNYILAQSLPVENGVNRIIIRSTTRAGNIALVATSAGLKTAMVTLVSNVVNVTDGWSLNMPDAGLPSYLKRGPTPPATDLTLTRQPVRIASVAAGANTEKANQSFDDNETTEWASGGKLANGWIKYEFAQPARVSEVTLKLANWRTRSYPIRIMVDDQLAYAGETPRSLGYVTLTFPPVTGHSLKIELTGHPKDVDAFGQIIEVTGQKDSAAADKDEKGTLSIVEIEIYER